MFINPESCPVNTAELMSRNTLPASVLSVGSIDLMTPFRPTTYRFGVLEWLAMLITVPRPRLPLAGSVATAAELGVLDGNFPLKNGATVSSLVRPASATVDFGTTPRCLLGLSHSTTRPGSATLVAASTARS